MADSLLDESIFSDAAASSDFEPDPKPRAKVAKKVAAPKATTKAVPKKQTTTKAKPASKKRAKPDSDDENSDMDATPSLDGSVLHGTPPSAKKQKKVPGPKKVAGKPLQTLENDAVLRGGDDSEDDTRPKKSSTERYQKLTQLEHIIKRPDTFVGSVEREERQMWVFSTEKERMEYRAVSYVPGLYKIFDEILVNAADNKQNDKTMNMVKVNINREMGEISVWNNGRGIPIEIHGKEGIYIPEMIFGHLLTSSNYDDEQAKITGGRNGYGAKLCNIFSTKFTIETADSKNKKKYVQTWTKNMGTMGKAKITDTSKGEDYTMVTFEPDFAKFNMDGIDDDFEALVTRRVYDLAGTLKKVKVTLNGKSIKVNSFKSYMELYTKAIKEERGEEAVFDKSEITTDNPNERWEVGFAVSDGSFQQVSFVNSIATISGGSHVNYIADQICDKLIDVVKKRKVGVTLKPAQIRNHLFLFVNCQIVNPAFTSQTKEQLTTKVSKFGSKCVVSDKFLKDIAKTEVVTNIMAFAEKKADQIMKKSDGAKRNRMDNPKLTDANKAGTKEGYRCTLILTEGDSAKALAMAGRSICGPDYYGVFPLRGKILNVRDASVDQISKNAEIQNIKSILGLKHKAVYMDCKSMRYGHLMIMTDQDHDGSHIKGLLINFLQVTFPSLLTIPEFLVEFITPIIRVYRGNPKNPSKSQFFFTMPQYEQWKEEHKHERGWDHKYYKGLGTSTTEDAQIYFAKLDEHRKMFHVMREHEPPLIELAFSKKKADERKEWLRQFVPGTFLDHSNRLITYDDFVNKELILFSMADNIRSIPSVVDGLKPGQRKVIFGCFKKNLKKDMKVVELAGHILGLTAYQHGESSLQQTIVGLAQTFVGSNNLNVLEPSGNFGSRLQGGSDCASARYIYTRLSPFARKVFHPLDEPLLKWNLDDDKVIEPQNYMPIVPLLLINGTDGIGTGWSSSIPNYNPEDIVSNLKRMMDGFEPEPMQPWFRDYKGQVTQTAPDRFKFSGIINQTGDNEVQVTELPIRVWTQDFKDKLSEIIKAEKGMPWIKDYDDYNTHKNVNFVITLDDKHMKAALDEGLEERFKLSRSVATSNLVAFDPQGRITKYNAVEDILKEFFNIRLKYYQLRKDHQLKEFRLELEKLTNQMRFIQMIIDGKLIVSKKKKAILVAELKAKNFTPFPKVKDASKAGETEPVLENDEEDDDPDAGAYDYLLGMAIWSLTYERLEKLRKQMGVKEEEIDTLIKLSKEDLWKKDLNEFMAEWYSQLEEENQRQRAVTQKARRLSGKPISRKRKSDDDFEIRPTKKAPAKVPGGNMLSYLLEAKKGKAATASQVTKPAAKPVTKLSAFPKPASKSASRAQSEDVWMAEAKAKNHSDDSDFDMPIVPDPKPVAPLKKAPPIEELSDDGEAVRPASNKGRSRRVIRPKTYQLSSDEASDEDMLEDVGELVKGFSGDTTTDATSRPLFSTTATSLSRPSSSGGLAARKSPVRKSTFDDESADETDYTRLAPSKNTTAKATKLTEDEDSFMDIDESAKLLPVPALAKSAAAKKSAASVAPAKKLVRPAKDTVASKPTAKANIAEKRQVTLSPAAKAYTKKRAQLKSTGDVQAVKKSAPLKTTKKDDSDEEVANDMLSDVDDAPVVKPRGRPARNAASQPKKWVVEDDSGEEDEEDEEEPSGFIEDDDSE